MVSCKRHVPHSAVSAPGGNAVGDLYLDDGHTYDHKNKGAFARRRFEWSGNTLTSKEAPAPYGNPKADALELADFNEARRRRWFEKQIQNHP